MPGKVFHFTILMPCFLIDAASTLVEFATNGDVSNLLVQNLQKAKQILRAGCKTALC
jgi:hypothetical protein